MNTFGYALGRPNTITDRLGLLPDGFYIPSPSPNCWTKILDTVSERTGNKRYAMEDESKYTLDLMQVISFNNGVFETLGFWQLTFNSYDALLLNEWVTTINYSYQCQSVDECGNVTVEDPLFGQTSFNDWRLEEVINENWMTLDFIPSTPTPMPDPYHRGMPPPRTMPIPIP